MLKKITTVRPPATVAKGGDKKKYHDKFDKSKIDCRKYGEYGHFAYECDAMKKVANGVM